MAAPNPVVNLIVQGAKARGLDPAAVLAVASQEGLSGRIGDGGHAYGPFQLNNAGGVITGTHPAVNDPATQAWASSPAGISFALDRIASVARGLHGQQAVNAIVARFERPADPAGEIARANSVYGRYAGTQTAPPAQVGPVTPVGLAGPQKPAQRGDSLPDLFNIGNTMFGLPPLPTNLGSAPSRLPTVASSSPTLPAAQPTLRQAISQAKAPRLGGPSLSWLEHQAAPFGLTVTATTGGKHAPHSYHYQRRAIDLGGDPKNMAAAANFALAHPNQFTEMFYTGPGHPDFFISGGKVYPLSQLDPALAADHTDHVHWAR